MREESHTRASELSMLMVTLFARSSIARSKVLLRHIQAGFVNRLLDIFVNFLSSNLIHASEKVLVVACRHGTGPCGPIPIAPSPLH